MCKSQIIESLYPEMDWKGVMGMRDIVAHHYDLDAEIVYDVIKHDLPKLKDKMCYSKS